MESKIIIKQINNPDNPHLPIKYVDSKEYLTPKLGKDGKIITGVDENAYSIITIKDDELRKKTAAFVKKERESLEKLLNVELNPGSDFWSKFFIVLEDERVLDPINPQDKLHELFLAANRYVAPSKEAINEDPDYYTSLFYFHREVEETSKQVKDEKKRDKATSTLYSLSENNPNKLKQIYAYIFGAGGKELSDEEVYIKFKEFLEEKENKIRSQNIKRFLEAADKTPEYLGTKEILDKAVKKKIVTSKGGVYKRGDTVYGEDYETALEFLSLPENSADLASLKRDSK